MVGPGIRFNDFLFSEPGALLQLAPHSLSPPGLSLRVSLYACVVFRTLWNQAGAPGALIPKNSGARIALRIQESE